jgi:hypothetical protein
MTNDEAPMTKGYVRASSFDILSSFVILSFVIPDARCRVALSGLASARTAWYDAASVFGMEAKVRSEKEFKRCARG